MNRLFNNESMDMKDANELKVTSPGIFTAAGETLACLYEISDMLDEFTREIKIRNEGKISDAQPPESFSDNINRNLDVAMTIRGDLKRLIEEFRR